MHVNQYGGFEKCQELMREFDDFEKEIIRYLQGNKENNIPTSFRSMFTDLFPDQGIAIGKETQEGWICFNVQKFAYYDSSINVWIPKVDLSSEAARTTERIIKLIFLLDYLQGKGLVFLYDFAHPEEKASMHIPQSLRMSITEHKVVEVLMGFYFKEIVISQGIVVLVRNGFLTRKELQHRETITYANRSLLTGERSITTANRATGVSIILGLISVLLSLYSIHQSQKQLSAENKPKQEKPEDKHPFDKTSSSTGL